MIDIAKPARLGGDVDPRKLLATFSQYGFRKTSMQDIGRAAGVSRQSVYNKFGSKDAAYAWAIHAFLADMYGRIFAALSEDDRPPLQTIQYVFDVSMGESIEIVSNPHGTEIFDDVLQATHRSDEDWPLRFRARLGEFIHRHGYAASSAEGVEKAFVLISASKGILLEEESKAQFRADMKRIIETVLKD